MYYTRQCAVIKEWWNADRILVPNEYLVIGQTYYVYLYFKGVGVSVSETVHGNICHYWCPGEVLYQVTYKGNRRICNFISNGDISDISYCRKCNHYCSQTLSSRGDLTSVDACRADSVSELRTLWSNVLLEQDISTSVVEWLARDNTPSKECLSTLVGFNITTPDNYCVSNLKDICYKNNCLKKTTEVICRIKLWNPWFDERGYLECDKILLDYYLIDKNKFLLYRDNVKDQLDTLKKTYPNTDVLIGLGGTTFETDIIEHLTTDADNKIQTLSAILRNEQFGVVIDRLPSTNISASDIETKLVTIFINEKINVYSRFFYYNATVISKCPIPNTPLILRIINGVTLAEFIDVVHKVPKNHDIYMDMPMELFASDVLMR